ncbi:MAG: hypothetical protein Q8Q50_08680, partial [Methylobacter sp.]|nr:hypothetical protein [Methylobacter sp.]
DEEPKETGKPIDEEPKETGKPIDEEPKETGKPIDEESKETGKPTDEEPENDMNLASSGVGLRSASQHDSDDSLKPSDILDDQDEQLFSTSGSTVNADAVNDSLSPFNMEQAPQEDLNQEGTV